MSNILIAKINGRIVSQYSLSATTALHIKALANATYAVIDSKTGKLVKGVKIKKDGDDLVLEASEQAQIVIDDFFDNSLEVSYLSEDGVVNDADALKIAKLDELQPEPPAPPPDVGAGATAAASSAGTSLPTVGLAAAGVAGGGGCGGQC